MRTQVKEQERGMCRRVRRENRERYDQVKAPDQYMQTPTRVPSLTAKKLEEYFYSFLVIILIYFVVWLRLVSKDRSLNSIALMQRRTNVNSLRGQKNW